MAKPLTASVWPFSTFSHLPDKKGRGFKSNENSRRTCPPVSTEFCFLDHPFATVYSICVFEYMSVPCFQCPYFLTCPSDSAVLPFNNWVTVLQAPQYLTTLSTCLWYFCPAIPFALDYQSSRLFSTFFPGVPVFQTLIVLSALPVIMIPTPVLNIIV